MRESVFSGVERETEAAELTELTEKLLEVWEKVELECGVEATDAVLFVERVVVRRSGESGGVNGRFCELSRSRRLAADLVWRTAEGMDITGTYAEDGGRYVMPIAL